MYLCMLMFGCVGVYGVFNTPVICSAAKIFEKLGTPPKKIADLSARFDNLRPGTVITHGAILFTKLEDVDSSSA
eukprot:m.847193 g.847193  ORF g.847193 m.847193 type:complete len:74 (-) comp23481_c0_seq5:283-504(-)